MSLISQEKLSSLQGKLKKIPSAKSFFIMTFGCQMNQADSEKIHMLFAQAGLSHVDTWKEADIVIFNTCSVRQKGEDRVFGFIDEIETFRRENNKKMYIGVTGCMTRKTGINKKYYEYTGRKNTTKITLHNTDTLRHSLFNSDDELFLRTESIDFVVRIEEIGTLMALISLIYGEDIGNDEAYQSYLKIDQARSDTKSANVIIQTGCDNYCTFCIVPFTRGKEISRPRDEIISECEKAIQNGAKEITLLGQNVNSYGKETKKSLWNAEELTWQSLQVQTPFRELLEKIDALPGIDRIRFTSSNPHDMTRDILDAHFDLSHCCHFLHFALQSGNNDILKKMNRRHTYEDFRSQVQYLRSRDESFGISTDIIVGFPGETDEQFEDTVRAFYECEFDYAYIARYSPRKETYAAKMPHHISPQVKAHRWDRLNEVMFQIVQKRNTMMIGREEVILVSKIDAENGAISGRTRNFKEVFIEKNNAIKIGDLISVLIQDIDRWILRGKYL